MKSNAIVKVLIFIFILSIVSISTYGKETDSFLSLTDDIYLEQTGVKCISNYSSNISDIKEVILRKMNVSTIESKEKYITIIGCQNSINYEVIIEKGKGKGITITAYKDSIVDETRLIKSSIRDMIRPYCNECTFYSLVKGKSKYSTVYDATKRINNSLLTLRANDIKTIDINSGISGIANIQERQLNYAICKYNTGVYVILASPVIFETY